MGKAERKEQFNPVKEELVVIVMGSPADEDYAGQIKKTLLDGFGVDSIFRVGSAHKTPEHLLSLVREYDGQRDKRVVYIAVAGRSNALGGFIDANTQNPVISAPPYSEKYAGLDLLSSLRMPSGIGTTVASEAEIAALMAIKIFALNNPELQAKLGKYQKGQQERLIQADQKMQGRLLKELKMVSIPEREGFPIPQVLETVDLPVDLFGPKKQGKARDTWVLPDGKIRVMVTTDRQSAYDRLVCLVSGKGRQLNMLSAFWFEKTADIVPNHLLAVPHPNVMICQQREAILLEMVVRGYITGESSTSLWRNYRDKTSVYHWLELPSGLRKNQKLPEIVFTLPLKP